MYNRTLDSFVPDVYKDVEEMDTIVSTEQIEVSTMVEEMARAFDNTFVLKAHLEGIEMFEDMLSILANPDVETLEFRRQRILNRFQLLPPFTFRFLKQQLDRIVGVGKWNSWIDYDTYTLYIESSAESQQWAQELTVTVEAIKPANIVFVSSPLISDNISLNETTEYSEIEWMYKLGQWRLGQWRFNEFVDKGVIKMASTKSLSNTFLNEIATDSLNRITKIRINGTLVISTFEERTVTSDTINLKYRITQSQGISNITKIELLDSSNNVLTTANVYVPVLSDILVKHTFKVKEE